jgi:uncharacterized protein (TIGR02246 family)
MDTTTRHTENAIRELGARWAAAEVAGDAAAMADLTVDDFTMVGPAGFVLTREQWLHRYDGGRLVTHALEWTDVQVRDYGDTAVAIGVHTQRAAHEGRPVDGSFRGTHIAVRRDGVWKLAGLQLSPMAWRPPATPAAVAPATAAG